MNRIPNGSFNIKESSICHILPPVIPITIISISLVSNPFITTPAVTDVMNQIEKKSKGMAEAEPMTAVANATGTGTNVVLWW